MAIRDYGREVNEAVLAGREALARLNEARSLLDSAGNWGIVDILGGGLLTTMIKRSKMKDADSVMQEARHALKRFQKELMDVENIPEFHIEMGDFLAFADYFFDGIIADVMVQSRISDAKRQVDNAIRKVEYIMNQLRACR
ncbi:MAG: hypothetical protein HFH91_07000 [Lachnospiraceae bacterium]|nr:hypothetical protein [Lachnospiraceae bacterium]